MRWAMFALGSTGGLVHEDTRFLSRWELRLGGRRLSLLKSSTVGYDTASFFLANPELPGCAANSSGGSANAGCRRRRAGAARGVQHGDGGDCGRAEASRAAPTLPTSSRCAVPFATGARISPAILADSSLRFRYRVPGFVAETMMRVERSEVVEAGTGQMLSPSPPRIDGSEIVWEVELPPAVRADGAGEGRRARERGRRSSLRRTASKRRRWRGEASLTGWLERIPGSSRAAISSTTCSADRSLISPRLRISGDLLGERYELPAAGLPWFMTLFGRDTLITSLQTLWVSPRSRTRRAAPARRLAGNAGRRLPRRGAGQDHARGQKRGADAAR